jgi:hypothetical protein
VTPADQNDVAHNEVTVRSEPCVEDPCRLQRGLQPGPVLFGHTGCEVGHLPQRRSRPGVAVQRIPGVRGWRGVVATGLQACDLCRQLGRLRREGVPAGRELRVLAAQGVDRRPRRVIDHPPGRVLPFSGRCPFINPLDQLVRVIEPQFDEPGLIGAVGGG